jgi:hypothetical protein
MEETVVKVEREMTAQMVKSFPKVEWLFMAHPRHSPSFP